MSERCSGSASWEYLWAGVCGVGGWGGGGREKVSRQISWIAGTGVASGNALNSALWCVDPSSIIVCEV